MKLSKKEVENLAQLGCFALNEDEKELYCAQLSEILEYTELLNHLDTKDVAPTYYVLPMVNVKRKDQKQQPLSLEDVFRNAPQQEENYFRVPRIL